MSVTLNPSSSLGFKRPLTQLVKRSLSITNNNAQPVAFKVKTTAPKLYCVRPNSGRVEPGESVEVSVMLQAMKEEPPLNAKCKDKFLIQSTVITPEKEALPLHDIWSTPEGTDDLKVYQQKLRVVYLPAEGQTLEEEDESPNLPPPNPSSLVVPGAPFITASHRAVNGYPKPIPDFSEPPPQEPPRPSTPLADFSVARDTSHAEELSQEAPLLTTDEGRPPSPSPSAHVDRPTEPERVPSPVPPPSSVSVSPLPTEPTIDVDMLAKFNDAQMEIERLRTIIATMSASPPPELRRRNRVLSDDGSVAETEVATVFDDGAFHQEGVPLQVVVIIMLGVFITTYLFF